jgi:2,4-dienoyl-CoA reductase-like NADH-dependent reductase (Old Yellow Enzyme family)
MPAHIAGWKKVTAAVHDKGGHIFIQIMHAGRMSHPDNTLHHRQAVAPSAIAPGTQMFTARGMQDIPAPRALTTEEVRRTVADFRLAARRAIEAGADGVEIHGANAYLVQQFFAPSANTRTDEYGGSIANRARFAIEVATAIAGEIDADRTAIRYPPAQPCGGSTKARKPRPSAAIWSLNSTSLVLLTCTSYITATSIYWATYARCGSNR